MTRVASYNIRKSVGRDYRRDPARVLSVLKAMDPDIVALQEVDRRFGRRASSIPRAMLADKTDLEIVDLAHRPDSIGWHGNAILLRRGTKVQDIHTLALAGLEPRGAVVVDLENLRVVGVHLALLRRARQAQAAQISAFLARLPFKPTLIMGDFNDGPHSVSIEKYLVTDDFYNPMAHLKDTGNGTSTYNDEWFLFDQIIFSKHFFDKQPDKHLFKYAEVFDPKFVRTWKGKRKNKPFRTYIGKWHQGGYSDHFPVYAYLEKIR